MNWIPLHVHSHYSLLDGLSKPEDIVAKCKKSGYTACALTDHGSISGCIDFFIECTKANIKPILGCEFYVGDTDLKNRELSHVVILAKNLQGWKELIQCVSKSNTAENFYYKPRISYADMKTFLGNNNHICISGHPGTEISSCLFLNMDVFDAESYEEAKAYLRPDWKNACKFIIDQYLNIFASNFFLEIQLIDQEYLPAAKVIAECLREIGSELNIPMVATSDSHYIDKEDAVLQRILLCSSLRLKMPKVVRSIQKKEKVPLKCFFVSDNYHIPSLQEMQNIHTEEELLNSVRIAEMCEQYDILSKPILPKFKCPNGIDEFEYLKDLCSKGWSKLKLNPEQEKVYKNRLEEELSIINEAGLSGYFLIVQDIVNWVRSKGWLPGPGRGCFVPDTRVKMGNGLLKPIQNIEIGDFVIDCYGEKQMVYNKFEYDVDEEILEIEFENNKIVRCTKDHKFLTSNRGWVEAQDLTEDDDIVEV